MEEEEEEESVLDYNHDYNHFKYDYNLL